ncbi:MAG: alkaline phosphatase D family protein [Pseudomonadota bacterium]
MPAIKFNRRHFLKGSAAVAVTTGLWFDELVASVESMGTTSMFTHGVASGEPQQDSVLLWTRVNPDNTLAKKKVEWEICLDPTFTSAIKRGLSIAEAQRDHTVKVVVNELSQGTTYYYRFFCNGEYSEIGRTKTLASGNLDTVTLAIASCSNFAFGFFNAYDDIARDDSIDYVLHLGDYIYEYGQDGWGGEISKSLGRQHLPSRETVSLSDYRIRHGQYKRDSASRIMHASHPLIPIWDDHESTNNPYMHGAQNHQPDAEGDWSIRRSASLQAYFEWMPVYDPKPSEDPAAMWRKFEFGDLATMVTLETRHTGRSKQIDYKEHLATIDTPESLKNFITNVLNDPEKKMLSPEMESFYTAAFSSMKENKNAWRLIANQIPMARTHVPRTEDFIPVTSDDPKDPLLEERRGLAQLSRLNLPLYTDTWDGYPRARERFYEMNKKLGIRDLLVLTGDSHSFWTNQLFNDQNESMGIELGTAGISSPSDFLSFNNTIAEEMDKRLAEHNKEVIWTNGRENGYVKLVIEKEMATAEYRTVSTVKSRNYKSSLLKSVALKKDNGRLVFS